MCHLLCLVHANVCHLLCLVHANVCHLLCPVHANVCHLLCLQYRGIVVKDCYADFDRHHIGLVTESQVSIKLMTWLIIGAVVSS